MLTNTIKRLEEALEKQSENLTEDYVQCAGTSR